MAGLTVQPAKMQIPYDVIINQWEIGQDAGWNTELCWAFLTHNIELYTKPRKVDATPLETWKISWENIENIGLSSSQLPSKGPAHLVHPDGKQKTQGCCAKNMWFDQISCTTFSAYTRRGQGQGRSELSAMRRDDEPRGPFFCVATPKKDAEDMTRPWIL